MAQNFLEALRGEISDLERALAQDVRYVRLRELQRVLGLYELPINAIPDSASMVAHVDTAQTAAKPSGRRPSPERERALDAVRILLEKKSEPTPTREILSHLEAEGIDVGGEMPLNNLSAMLSNSDLFIANGRSGWTLMSSALEDIAKDVANPLALETISEIIDYYKKMHSIQSDVSAKLLTTARSRIGRDLSDKEKSKLRALFLDEINKTSSIFN